MSTKTFCSVLWNHQSVDGTGRVKPCCRFLETCRPKNHTLDNYTIEEIFNSDFQNDLRKRVLAGERLEGCKRCYEEEDNNKESFRMVLNNHDVVGEKSIDPNNYKLKYLELALGNDCNLMCRMCNSQFSYKLFDEELEYRGKTFSKNKHTKADLNSIYTYIKDIKYLKFTGGEPFIIPDHWTMLKHVAEKGDAKNIRLNYLTNGTVFPKQKIINIWKEFSHVELGISLDSIIKEENTYQRHLINHDQALTNIAKYVEIKDVVSMSMFVKPTVTIFSIYHLPETLEWLDTQGIKHITSHVTYPEHLSVTILPNIEKNKIVTKFSNYNFKNNETKKTCEYIINYMMSEDNSHLLDKFKKHTSFLDKTRNQSFKKSYPYFDF